MSKYGFDLDGTLDRPGIAQLVRDLLDAGKEVHIISGRFLDAEWQSEENKMAKLRRLNIPVSWITKGDFKTPFRHVVAPGQPIDRGVHLHILDAMPVTLEKNHDYVVKDLGLRKGALCEELGITLMFDDSPAYIRDIHAVSGTDLVEVK